MARKISLDGVVHSFPDDATDDEIQAALGQGGVSQTHALPTDQQIQEAAHQPSGALDTAVGALMTGGTSALMPGNLGQEIGRGVGDFGARALSNTQKFLGLQSPERTAAVNAQTQPSGAGEAAGQAAIPALAAILTPGGALTNAAIAGGTTALDTGDPTKAAVAGAAGGLLSGVDKLTPMAKWNHVKAIIKLLQGNMGAAVGAYEGGTHGGVKGAVEGAVLGKILDRYGANASKTSSAKLTDAIRRGAESDAARILWRLLPPAVAHATGDTPPQEVKFEDAQSIAEPASVESMLAEAKRRKAANAVLR